MTERTCESCIHSDTRTFAGREELRCFKFAHRFAKSYSFGWSILRERGDAPEFADPNRCGPEGKNFEPKEQPDGH